MQPLRGKEGGVTTYLKLVSQDADKFLNGGFVEGSWTAGQTPKTIVERLCNQAKHQAELGFISPNLDNKALARGKVVFGLAKDYMRQVARTEAAAFYCDDGKVHIVKAPDPPTGQVINLCPKTGLIGTAEMTDEGVNATCLLNPMLCLNGLVHIKLDHVRTQKAIRGSEPRQPDEDGIYRIIKITHEGDTRGNPWYTKFVGVAQDGAVHNVSESMR